MKITRREMFLGAAALAAVLAGATWYIVDKKVDEYASRATEIEKLKQQISYHQNAIKMQENWLGELNDLQKDLRVFDAKQRSVAPDLMKTIKAISDKYGLDITRNNPRSEKPTGDLFELGINCTWEGNLDSMVGFLTALQQQGLRYDVRSLNVKPIGTATGRLGGNMLIMCAYTRKPMDAAE